MHAYRPGQGAARSRVLYLFRSPPLSQIGRKPLDAEVREALEHTHPDLTFDWVGLLREPMPPPRPDPRERSGRQRPAARSAGRPSSGPSGSPSGSKDRRDAAPAPAPAAMSVVIEDDTTLGRVVGGAEAARLRARFAELNQRISRRARTPEDRDRLLEAAGRQNPDDWGDEAAIRANLAGVDARWDAITAELPRRRRGRRGGKSREDGNGGAPDPDQDRAADVIIGERDGHDDHATTDLHDQPLAPLAVADVAGSSGNGDDERPAGPAADDDPETDLRQPG
jgi:hypothetical protein